MEKTTTIDAVPTAKQKMPELLKVLCILTFIGVTLFDYASSIYNYATIDKKILEFEAQSQKVQDSGSSIAIGMMADAETALIKSQQNKTEILIVHLIAGLLCLIGAILMWKLKKNGFFVYTVGELIPTIFTFVVIGFGSGTFAIITSAFSVVIPLVFIGLYASQLKYMD